MNGKTTVVLLALAMFATADVRSPADERIAQRTFHECFLYRDADGAAWVGQPLVSLGMIGVMGGPPQYRLSPELAQRFAPLVNILKDTPDQPQFWWWELPSLDDESSPLVLLRIKTQAELRQPRKSPESQENLDIANLGGSPIYEITSAELVYAEVLSAKWRRAWKSLDAGLHEIVKASLTAPSKEKTERLSDAIEKSSRALNQMVAAKVEDHTRKLVGRIEPDARCVRLFQRSAAGSDVGRWGGQLRDYIATLRIEPPTPLPKPAKPCPKVKFLAECESPADLIAKIKESWPEDVLDERLIFSMDLECIVFVWQVENLTPQQFASLQEDAKRQLASDKTPIASGDSSQDDATIPEWNVTIRAADNDLLAEKGMLRGTVVAELLADTSPVGLHSGDLIIDYRNVYDLVMGRFENYAPPNQLSRIAEYGGTLDVLRGDRLITLKVEGR